MKLLAIAASAAILHLSVALAAVEDWTHDFAAAKKQAASENKNLLIRFSGSDWCGPCIAMEKAVLSKAPFNEAMGDDFVFVELDYPRDKSKQSVETQKQNEELREKYPIVGFPTIMFADAEGKPYAAQFGYNEQDPDSYLKSIIGLKDADKARDQAFAKAKDMEGVEKAKTLVEALEVMQLNDASVFAFYRDIADQIRSADPSDETGFVKNIRMNAKYAEFENQLRLFSQQQNHDGAMKLVGNTLATGGFEGEKKQQITTIKAAILAERRDFDGAIKTLEEAKAVDPGSELAGRIDESISRINEMKAAAEANAALEGEKDGE